MRNGAQNKSAYLIAAATLFASALPCAADEYAEGARQYSAGNFSGARAHFVKATAAKPKSWQAHYQLANTCIQLKDSENARKSYSKCLGLNPPPDIKARCQSALAYIASNPTLAAPVAATPAYRPSMYSRPSGSSSPASSAPAAGANPQAEAQRTRILHDGEVEVEKMKADEAQRLKEMEANSNQTYRYPDGSVKTGLTPEEEAQFQKEVEQKAAAIRERAKRSAAAVR